MAAVAAAPMNLGVPNFQQYFFQIRFYSFSLYGIPGLSQLDNICSYIVVVINVCPTKVSFSSHALKAKSLRLHPVQVYGGEARISTFVGAAFREKKGLLINDLHRSLIY